MNVNSWQSKVITWCVSMLSLVVIGTVAAVWLYHTPAIASLQQQVSAMAENIVYIRDRVDSISDRLPPADKPEKKHR